ncbi:hypothetical protein [Brevibacterium iodinum]|nr:hypothetical protein [Brevibacterium iodinum]WGP06992.1 hypothetical protein QFE97_04305 [Bacillus subtilis]
MRSVMREIRFFLDWGPKYPIWETGTDKYAMEPSDYGLTLELDKALRSYVDFWNEHFIETDDSFEWDSSENKKAFDAEGDRLIRWLQDEVKGIAHVRDER